MTELTLKMTEDLMDLGFRLEDGVFTYASGSWATYTKARVSFYNEGKKASIDYAHSLFDGDEMDGETTTHVTLRTEQLLWYLKERLGFRSQREWKAYLENKKRGLRK